MRYSNHYDLYQEIHKRIPSLPLKTVGELTVIGLVFRDISVDDEDIYLVIMDGKVKYAKGKKKKI